MQIYSASSIQIIIMPLSAFASPSPFMRVVFRAKKLAADSFVPPIEPEQQS